MHCRIYIILYKVVSIYINYYNTSYPFFRTGVKSLYGLSRSVMWVLASSSVILFAPVIFEVERAQVEEMQKSQQKQVIKCGKMDHAEIYSSLKFSYLTFFFIAGSTWHKCSNVRSNAKYATNATINRH